MEREVHTPLPFLNLMWRIINKYKMLKIFPHFRPDLLDWRQVERRDVRERIDLAFHIMDREYGVTRLLDPEGESSAINITTIYTAYL